MRTGIVAFLVFWMVGYASAATLHVANYGTVSGGCGLTAPCRTISQAITNASAGDTIMVGPGRYGDLNGDGMFVAADGDEASGSATNMIVINKKLTLISSAGAAATVLDNPTCSSGVTTLVSIQANGVKLGAKGKGFTMQTAGCGGMTGLSVDTATSAVVVGGNRFRIYGTAGTVNGTGHTVQNNLISGYGGTTSYLIMGGGPHMVKNNTGENGGLATAAGSTNITLKGNRMLGVWSGVGFDLQGSGHVVKANVASGVPYYSCSAGYSCHGDCGSSAGLTLTANVAEGPCTYGFDVSSGTGHVFTGNLAASNSYGFSFDSPMAVTLKGNEASGNSAYGIFFSSGVTPVVTKNSVIGNVSYGIYSTTVNGHISMNNIYGNDPTTNCGIYLGTSGTLAADQNYWGKAGGPGADPADAACAAVGTINASAPSAVEFPVAVPRFP